MEDDFLPDKDGKIPFKKHTEHHIWIEYKKSKEKKANDMYQKVKTSLLIGLIGFIFTSLGTVVWFAFNAYIGKK